VEEHGHAVSEQSVEPVVVIDAEVGECVVVHRHTAAEPSVGGVADAESVEFACGPDAVGGGVEPEGHEDAGIDMRVARSVLCGLDAVVEVREVESLCEVPDGSRGVVGREQLVE
jgi:hypothetical protein